MRKLEKQNAELGSGSDYKELKVNCLAWDRQAAPCRGGCLPTPTRHPVTWTLNIK